MSNLTGVCVCHPLVGFRIMNQPATVTDPNVIIFRVGTHIYSRSWSQTTCTCHVRPPFPVLSKVIRINYSSKRMRYSTAEKQEPNCCVFLRKNAFVNKKK